MPASIYKAARVGPSAPQRMAFMRQLAQLAVLATLVVSGGSCSASEGSSSSSQALRVVQELFAAWSEHQPERLDTLLVPGAVYEDVGAGKTYTGTAAIEDYLRSVFRWAPDFAVELTFFAAAGDTVAMEWTMSGTQTGAVGDLPPTGRKFVVRGASVLELQGGRILRNSDYYDMASMLIQLGAEFKAPSTRS
jgi:steroid delta-isomerase-like uncharacterized protein